MTGDTLRMAYDTGRSFFTSPHHDLIFPPHKDKPRGGTDIAVVDYDPYEAWENEVSDFNPEEWPHDPGPKQYLIEYEDGSVHGPWRLDAMRQVEGVEAVWEWKYEGGTEERIEGQPLAELLEGES